ncbi:hypothetical protein [Paludisphaera rhizosphaerae]|uniref:hypothetical protein n=1 Tax=Paludisphaera rhizosphaerae TaxID=2711216 RepID=UPI0013EC6B71|nr:hypothetical protein [Paludisphaera rhizosphaerae]
MSRLRRRHHEEARIDVHSIHPSWLIRALQDESPAVRSVVAAHGPEAVAKLLRASDVRTPEIDPHPEILRWVLSLWTERLVGGSDRDDHPPVVAALTRTSPRESYRLWRTVGMVKKSLAGVGGPAWIRERLGESTSETRAWAARDVESALALRLSRFRTEGLLGLATAFRLLPECDPFVMRWALQRLPYPIVRQARGIVSPSSRRSPAVVRLETLILKTAWDRLSAEGRIRTRRPSRANGGEDER